MSEQSAQQTTTRTALVTGATRGIGRGIAQTFAEKGAAIMSVSRSAEDGEQLVAELQALGSRAAFVAGDVSNWSDVQCSVEKTNATFGPVNILCCNAGIYPTATIAEISINEWDRVLAVNLKSNFMYVKACLPDFERAPGGRVILTASITGAMTGHPGWAHYGASKAGQLGFLRSAALELAAYGATVNAILPGNFTTDSTSDTDKSYDMAMAAHIPVGRLGRPHEIGYAACFLASEHADFITGQTLVVDGGQSLFEYQGNV